MPKKILNKTNKFFFRKDCNALDIQGLDGFCFLYKKVGCAYYFELLKFSGQLFPQFVEKPSFLGFSDHWSRFVWLINEGLRRAASLCP